MQTVIQADNIARSTNTDASVRQSALLLTASHGPGARDEAGRRFEICKLLRANQLARHWRLVDILLGEIQCRHWKDPEFSVADGDIPAGAAIPCVSAPMQ